MRWQSTPRLKRFLIFCMEIFEKKAHWPDEVLLAQDAAEDALSERVLSRLPSDVPIRVYDKDPQGVGNDAQRFTQGKKVLVLKRFPGEWLKACPGTKQHVCCNLWVVNPGEGCPMDCTYCYLQEYLLRSPSMKLYTNVADLLSSIENLCNSNPTRLYRIGTGELMDSLVWDDLTDFSSEIVPLFKRLDNGLLELKTKSACVDNLIGLEHGEKTVVSWSVNAHEICDKDEALTASLSERVLAAAKVIEAGYRVGLHFDPLIIFPGWEDAYNEAVDFIFSSIDSSRIAWISVSTLRYKQPMQAVMQERFPQSKIPYGEQIRASDGKRRYIQPLRFKLVKHVWERINMHNPDVPKYMCMESRTAWRDISGGSPAAGSELAEVFSKKGKLRVLNSQQC